MTGRLENLLKIAAMVQVFRLEKNRWPHHAAELSAFSLQSQMPVDFSRFHILVFREEENGDFGMEFNFQDEENPWAACGRWEISQPTRGKNNVGWKIRYVPLPAKRLEPRIYCLVSPRRPAFAP